MPLEKPRPKTPKRVMEKKRRARINESLTELKSLVLQALNRNNSRHSKLEKADILEMTVKYLRGVHGRHSAAKATVSSGLDTVSSQYRTGFAECMHEVANFFQTDDGDTGVKLQLLDHLSKTCTTPQSPPIAIKKAGDSGSTSSCCNLHSPIDGNLSQSLQIFGIPTKTTSQVSLHSVPSSTPLTTTDSVQSVTAMQINNPPILPVMNIQYPAPLYRLPPVPAPISLPAPSVTIQPPPPPPLSSLLQPKAISLRLEGRTWGENSNSNVLTKDKPTSSEHDKLNYENSTVQSTAPIMPLIGETTAGGDVTVILPHTALQGGRLPTHLIPVYQPNNNSNVPNTIEPIATGICQAGPSSAYNSTPGVPASSTTTKLNQPITSPRMGTIAPVTLLTSSAYLTANIGQCTSAFSPQGTPFTITLPIHARIVPNLIPVHAVTVSSSIVPISNPTHSFSLPLRIANPAENVDENGLMWRPWKNNEPVIKPGNL